MADIHTEQLSDRVVIRIRGDFTFDINREFREAYQAYPPGSRFEVDLSQTRYMDSAGLGMLIRLREHAASNGAPVTLSGAAATVHTILDVANFSRLFDIR